MKRLSNFIIYGSIDSFDSGTISIKHSSTNTNVESFFAYLIILNNRFFFNNFPVGLFGLHMKTHPFFGIFEINSSRFSDKSIVFNYEILQLFSLAAISYSWKVGIGIKTLVSFDKNAKQKV